MAMKHGIALFLGGFAALFVPLFTFFLMASMWNVWAQLGVVVAFVVLARPITWVWYDAITEAFRSDDDEEK